MLSIKLLTNSGGPILYVTYYNICTYKTQFSTRLTFDPSHLHMRKWRLNCSEKFEKDVDVMMSDAQHGEKPN